MTYQHSVGPEGLRMKFMGKVTHDDIVDCCVAVAADPDCHALKCAVIDLSRMEGCSFPRPDLSFLALASRRLLDPDAPGSRIVLIPPVDAASRAELARFRIHAAVTRE